MKSITILLLFVCLLATLTSCVKTDISPNAAYQSQLPNNGTPTKDQINPITGSTMLAGNWTLVNDSTSSTSVGTDDKAWGANYLGQPGDYFKFTAAGKVYIKEGSSIDTANYTITTDNKIQLIYSYYANVPVTNYGSMVANFDQLNLTTNTVTLTTNVVTANGATARIINLKR